MDSIYNYLISTTDCKVDRLMDENTKEVTHIYVNQKDIIYYCICGPHSGNGFTYLVRADAAATHDRWSNCDWEHEFESAEQVISFFRIGGMEAVAEYCNQAIKTISGAIDYMLNEIRHH